MNYKWYKLLIISMSIIGCDNHTVEKGDNTHPPQNKEIIKPNEDVILELSLTKDDKLALGVYNYFRERKCYEAAYAWITIANLIKKQDGYNEKLKECIAAIGNEDNLDPESLAIKYSFKPEKQEDDYYKAFYWMSESHNDLEGKGFSKNDLNQALVLVLQQYMSYSIDTDVAREILGVK